jgi:heterodisulfide reductase subunit A
MVQAGGHPNITLFTYSEIEKVEGYVGNFTVTMRKKARYVSEELCTGCGICQEKCPKKVIDEIYEAGLGFRKAVYTPFPQAVPKFPVIDTPNCTFFQKGTCKACENSAQPERSISTSKTRTTPIHIGSKPSDVKRGTTVGTVKTTIEILKKEKVKPAS